MEQHQKSVQFKLAKTEPTLHLVQLVGTSICQIS